MSIQLLETPTPVAVQSYVYFVRQRGTGYIKIGRSNCPTIRLASLKTSSPVELELLATFKEEGTNTEQRLHILFREHRAEGEWFFESQEILEYLKSQGVEVAPHVVLPTALFAQQIHALTNLNRKVEDMIGYLDESKERVTEAITLLAVAASDLQEKLEAEPLGPRFLSIYNIGRITNLKAPAINLLIKDNRFPAPLNIPGCDERLWDQDAVFAAMRKISSEVAKT